MTRGDFNFFAYFNSRIPWLLFVKVPTFWDVQFLHSDRVKQRWSEIISILHGKQDERNTIRKRTCKATPLATSTATLLMSIANRSGKIFSSLNTFFESSISSDKDALSTMIADYFCEEDSEEDDKHYYYFLILYQ